MGLTIGISEVLTHNKKAEDILHNPYLRVELVDGDKVESDEAVEEVGMCVNPEWAPRHEYNTWSVSLCCNRNACSTGVWESFSPLSNRILVDLATLPIILRFGIKLDTDFHHRGHGPTLLHLDELKAVRFSFVFNSS